MSKKKEIKPTSKRIKISPLNPLKGFEKIDMSKFYEEQKKRLEEEKKQYQIDLKKHKKDVELELKRIESLVCPLCKNTQKQRNEIFENRHEPVVFGGRNSPLKKLADYYTCLGCGIMYVDLNKKDIIHPKNPEDNFSRSLF